MVKTLCFCLLTITATSALAQDLAAPEKIVTLTPWPGITQLIDYQNKIWFAHSNPYQDTNAANIYSYDPESGETVFERSLFSQDVGKPVIHNGLLHWALEDPRRSAGTGEYAVTNGTDWQWRVIQAGDAMHVHALSTCNDQLVAVTGSWTGQYLRQQADSKSWTLQHDYPAGKARFSRLVDVLEYDGECYIAASANNDPQVRLLVSGQEGVTPVEQWPVSDRVDGLTVHNNRLFGWADRGNDRNLHVYNGKDVHAIAIEKGHRIRDMHSSGDTLYILSSLNSGGTLWKLGEEDRLIRLSKLPFIPVGISTDHKGDLAIGSFNRNGAELWKIKLKNTAVKSTPSLVADLDNHSDDDSVKPDFSDQYEYLRSLITATSHDENQVKTLRSALSRPEHLTHPEFAKVLTRLLKEPLPDIEVLLFSGRKVVWADLVHWYLITSLAINGHGTIDTNLLGAPWTQGKNRSNKYIDPTVAAIVATGWINQSDPQTITALIDRLTTANNDPAWLKADIAGALTAITGQRFGQDKNAWAAWQEGR